MKHLKHLFTALLLLCTTVVTAHDFEVGGIYYKIIDETNKTVAVTYQGASPDSYSGEYTGEISIPETVAYNGEIFRVVSIGEGAFFACPVLRIVIPNSVTNIEYGAFFNCQRLGSVTIPNGVTSIENCAFKQCYSLKVVCFEDGDSILSLGVNSYNKDGLGGGLFENCPLETLYLGRDLSYYTDASCGYSPFSEKFGKSRLKTVIIGNNVTSIGEGAFKNCSSLTAVKIGNSVTNIGEGAFMNCSSLTGIEIGNSVTSIGEGAFMDCSSLAAVEIGNSLTSIGEGAFDNCSALRLVINFSNLTFTEGSSDNGGVAYRALYVYNMPNGSIEGDFVFAKLNGVNTLCLYFGNEKELTLPADYNGGNYAIGSKVFFDGTGLTSITIPNSVTSIGDMAFKGCSSLKKVCFEDGDSTLSLGANSYNENYIGGALFYDCPLETLYLGRDLSYNTDASYGYSPFYNKRELKTVTIGNSVTSIGSYAFYGCSNLEAVINFSNLTFSKGSEDYGYVACYADKVYNAPNGFIDGDFIWYENEDGMTLAGYLGNATELALPADYNGKRVTSIGNYAFSGCKVLTSIEIPNSVTSIGAASFSNCHALTSIKIPNSVTSIGSSAFSWCYRLTSIEIPNSVTSIGHFAFKGCSYLKSIIIPNSVSSIGDGLFSDCNKSMQIINFSSVELTGNHNVINAPNGYIEGEFVYADINEVKTLCGCTVDKFSFDGLEYTINKGNFGTVTIVGASNEISGDLIIPDSVIYSGVSFKVSSINENVFFDRTGLTSINIPNSVTSIGNHTFYGCTGLTSVVIGNSVTSIGNNAFYNCWGLTSVTIPNSVTSIGKSAFYGCNGLESVEISNSVTSIGDEAFYGCAGLTSIEIPNSVTSLGFGAFKNCRSLTSVKIANSVTSIGSYAFSGCSGLTKVTLGSGVREIGCDAFEKCNAIANVYIRNLATWCNIEFFSSDSNPLHSGARLLVNNAPLTSFVTPKGVTEIKKYAFFGCKGLTSVNISGSVNNVGYSAFNSCADLKTITLSNKIEELCEYAFANCEKIGSVTIKRIIKDGFIKCDHNTFDKVTYTKATLYAHPSDWRTYYNAYGWGWYRFIKVVKRQ